MSYGGYHTEVALILRQAQQAGLKLTVMGGDTMSNTELATAAGPEANNVLFTFGPDARKNPSAAPIVKKFHDAKVEPEGYVLYAYAAFQLFDQAATKAKSTKYADLEKALRGGYVRHGHRQTLVRRQGEQFGAGLCRLPVEQWQVRLREEVIVGGRRAVARGRRLAPPPHCPPQGGTLRPARRPRRAQTFDRKARKHDERRQFPTPTPAAAALSLSRRGAGRRGTDRAGALYPCRKAGHRRARDAADAERYATAARTQAASTPFLATYDLSSREGVVLMCLAEALLRIPDSATVDRLIRDKIGNTEWERRLGASHSTFVNAGTWALMLTGRIVNLDNDDRNLGGTFKRLVARAGEPVIRQAVITAMRILGKQFVMGRNIHEAMDRARSAEKAGYRHSYDMLGESARSGADALRYFESYRAAIRAIGDAAAGRPAFEAPSISIKLSALHPRYEVANEDRVRHELLPVVKALAVRAKARNIGFTIDAEEADRLEMSLDLDRSARRRFRTGRLGRSRPRRPGLPEARPADPRLACRPRAPRPAAADGSPVQRRLLGCRNQARAGAWARRLSRVHPQGVERPLLPRLRPPPVRRSAGLLPGVCDAQCTHPGGGRRNRGERRRQRRMGIPAPARHGRRDVRPGRQR
jgi:hypothetical protein